MSGRGVLFAIDDEVLLQLGEATGDEDVRRIVAELEQKWEQPYVAELDKAWDPLHRMLGGGGLSYDGGQPPLSWAILGGVRVHDGDECIVTVKPEDQVAAISKSLRSWDRATARRAYYKIPKSEYGDLDEGDFDYVLSYFEELKRLYRDAAKSERAVVFAVEG